MAEDGTGMKVETKEDLKKDSYLAWFHSHRIHGPWSCFRCKAELLKPRYLKGMAGKRFVTLSWCSQDCLDKWTSQFKGMATRWEKYNEAGDLIGYVLPRRGFISLEDIEAAEMEKDKEADE